MMKNDPEFREDEPSEEKRFDSEAAQRILRRAAEEQARWDSEEAASYSLDQLREIATEAGISPEAVHAAAREHEASAERSALEHLPEDESGGGWLAALERRMPASWSPRTKRAVLAASGLAVLGLVVSTAGVAPVLFAISLVLLVLILLLLLVGLLPF